MSAGGRGRRPSARREAHPLTAALTYEGRIPKAYVEVEPGFRPGRVVYRRPAWRERDGVWAIRDQGCVVFVTAAEGGSARFRAWTTAELRAWEAARVAGKATGGGR